MLKHGELINELSAEQRVRLLTDLSNFQGTNIEGFPSVKMVDVDSITLANNKKLPNLNEIATTWDNSLVEEYYRLISYILKEQGKSLAVLKGGSIIDQSSTADKISDDGVLTGNMLNSAVNGITYNGVVPVVGEFMVNDNDIPYLDNKFNERAFRDTYLRPFQMLCENNNDFLIMANNTTSNAEYKEKNRNYFVNLLREDFHYNKLIVKNDYNEKDSLNNKFISLNNKVGLKGTFYENQVNDMLDELIDLIIKNSKDNQNKFSESDIDDIIYKTYLNSIVLMKNNSILPIRYMFDIGIVVNEKHPNLDVDSFSYKYHNCNTISVIQNASNMQDQLKTKEVVIVFLREKKGHIVDQDLHTIKNLHDNTKNVIGVITTPNVIDTSFDEYCDALIKVTDESDESIKTLLDVIYGKFSPCGKTTISYPNDIDESKEICKKINKNNQCLGECSGYRYYDKIGEKVKYPFGHGLSYCDFEFDNFNCSNEEITFTVKNNGIYAASEIVQIYLGIENSFVPRAEKRLYQYIKVTLRPNEIHKYKVKFNKNAFLRYDANNETYNYEKGIYSIYVNTSLNEIKLRGRILVDGVQFLPLKDEKSFKLIRNTKTEDKTRVVEQKKKKKKKVSINSILMWISTILAIVIMALSFAVENYSFASMACIIILIDIIYLIKNRVRKGTDTLNENNDDIVADIDLDELFEEVEIKENFRDDSKPKELENEFVKEQNIEYFDNSKIVTIFDELRQYVKSCGIIISDDDLKIFLASISSSKLIINKNNNQELFNYLIQVVNSYFGNESISPCKINEEVDKFGIFKDNESDTNILYKDLVFATKNEENMCFVSLYGANKDNIVYYNDIICDVGYEIQKTVVNIDNKTLVLPKNVWYLFSFEDMEEIYNLPEDILTNACVVDIELAQGETESSLPKFDVINLSSFDYLIRNVRKDKSISEDYYKKFDLLKDYINKFANFEYGNKLSISFETIVSILLFLDKNDKETIDLLVTLKVLPITYTLLNDKLESNEELYAELDRLFGEENLENSLKILDSIKNKVN